MKKISKKRKIIYSAIIVVILITITVVGVFVFNNTSYGIVETNNCLTSSLGDTNSKEIEIIGSEPLSNEEALKLIPLDFNISNSCEALVNYDLIIEINRLTNVDLSKIKIELNGEIIDFTSLILIPSDRGLIRYTLKSDSIDVGSELKEYTFRIWETNTDNNGTSNVGNIISASIGYEEK